ncbi:MAG: hypothetical protein ACREL5_00210 [Gemmatimonadales bacterium]
MPTAPGYIPPSMLNPVNTLVLPAGMATARPRAGLSRLIRTHPSTEERVRALLAFDADR